MQKALQSELTLDRVHVDGLADRARQPQHNLFRGLSLRDAKRKSFDVARVMLHEQQHPRSAALHYRTASASASQHVFLPVVQKVKSRSVGLTFLWKTGFVWPP